MKPALRDKLQTELDTSTDPSSTALRAKQETKPMFAIRDLSVLAYANGFTLWHYKTGNDQVADTGAQNFFNDAADMMGVGDLIMITGTGGAAIRVVSTADAGVVNTSKLG